MNTLTINKQMKMEGMSIKMTTRVIMILTVNN